MPAVHEDGQAHGGGAAQVGDRVEGGPDGAAGEEDVVHEHDDGAVEGDLGQAGGHRGAGRAAAEVVPVERHVHLADGGGGVEGRLDAGQQGAEPPGQGGPAARDPHQDETLGALVGLEDLVGDPGQRPVDLGRGQHGPGSTRCGGVSSHAGASFPASQDGS